MKNWKTTLFGGLAVLAGFVSQYPQQIVAVIPPQDAAPAAKIIGLLSLFLAFYHAQDSQAAPGQAKPGTVGSVLKVTLLFLLPVVIFSLAACAPLGAPSVPPASSFGAKVGQTLSHVGTAISTWWDVGGGKQEVEAAAEAEVTGIGESMIGDLVNGGKFDASQDAVSGAIEGLRTLEGTGQPLSTAAVASVVSNAIPDDPAVASTVSSAASQAIQTVAATGKVTTDQAIEIAANSLQQTLTTAKAASVP